jgi:GNAT superfamily N-acetyltransferase
MPYKIRESDDIEELELLHDVTFAGIARSKPDFTNGIWWIAYDDDAPVAFAGLEPGTLIPNSLYFSRVGVIECARGNGLQLRLMRTFEAWARRHYRELIVSDTTENVPSANNFIRAGYHLFEPSVRWAFQTSLYWRKNL